MERKSFINEILVLKNGPENSVEWEYTWRQKQHNLYDKKANGGL